MSRNRNYVFNSGFVAIWLGSWWKPWTWKDGWGVMNLRIEKSSGGRVLAKFRGKHAKLRATHRAYVIHNRWMDERHGKDLGWLDFRQHHYVR